MYQKPFFKFESSTVRLLGCLSLSINIVCLWENFFHAPIETKSSETKIFFEHVKVGKEILTGISFA